MGTFVIYQGTKLLFREILNNYNRLEYQAIRYKTKLNAFNKIVT